MKYVATATFCASALPTSFKARYVILKAYKKTGFIILSIHIVKDYFNTTLLSNWR